MTRMSKLDFYFRLIVVILLAATARGQIYTSNAPPSNQKTGMEVVPVSIYKGTLVYVVIPFCQISFQRDGKQYKAVMHIAAGLYRGKELVAGDSKRSYAYARSYRETGARNRYLVDSLFLDAPAGEYKLFIRAKQADRAGTFSYRENYTVPKQDENVVISDIVFTKDSVPRARLAIHHKDTLNGWVRCYSASRCTLFIALYRSRKRVGAWRKIVAESGGVPIKIATDSLPSGELTLVVSSGRTKRRHDFTIVPTFFEMDERDFAQNIDVLSIIASKEEMDSLRNAPPEMRDTLVARFWRRLDPTPATPRNEFREEFERRVRYANEHFSFLRRGYKSDRGRVYIRYGAPDQIESLPFDIDSRPYEIWFYYSLHRTFIFVDDMGNGEYILKGTE